MKPPYLTDEEDIAPSPWGKSGISYLKLLSTQINLCSDHRHRHQLEKHSAFSTTFTIFPSKVENMGENG